MHARKLSTGPRINRSQKLLGAFSFSSADHDVFTKARGCAVFALTLFVYVLQACTAHHRYLKSLTVSCKSLQ